ncbi:hypothetical protein ACFLVX_04295, partial [Chloroflexota bacterium]
SYMIVILESQHDTTLKQHAGSGGRRDERRASELLSNLAVAGALFGLGISQQSRSRVRFR